MPDRQPDRIQLRPTRYGVLFMAVLAAMLSGSINYNNNLGFLLTFLLGGIALISVFHTRRNLAGIQVEAVSVKPVFLGETAVFEAVIRTHPPARASIEFRYVHHPETVQDLKPDADNRVRIMAAPAKRGIFKPETLLISTKYPLGLFRGTSVFHTDIECIVYPKPLSGSVAFSEAASSAGEDKRQTATAGSDDFQGLRTWQPGDPVRHIAWKAFSKGQGLQTKEFVATVGTSVMIDWNAVNEPDPERRLSRLCDMVLKAHGLRMEYGLQLPGLTIEPAIGEAHRHRCLKALAIAGR